MDQKKKEDMDEETKYNPTFKNLTQVQKVGGKFVSSTVLSIEQVNKERKEKAAAAEKKR